MHIQNSDSTPATCQDYTYDILSRTSSSVLTAGTIICVQKYPVSN